MKPFPNKNYNLQKSYTDLSKESLYKRKESTASASLGDAVDSKEKTKEAESA